MTTETMGTTVQHTIGTDGLVALTMSDGDIRIRGVAGEDVRVRSTDGSPLDGLVIERGERSLSIRAGRDLDPLVGRGHGPSMDLELEVPASASVVIEGSSCDIVADGLTGDQRYRSASGDLLVRDAQGSLTVEAMSGDIDITADGEARFDLRTVSGDLALRAGVIGSLRATTTSGDLGVAGRFDGPGPFTVETVSGDVQFAPAGPVRVDVRTIAGDLHSELPGRREEGNGRRSFIVGENGPTIDVRSTSGDVHIRRPKAIDSIAVAPAAPTPPTPPTPPIAPTPPAAPTPPTPPAPLEPVGELQDDPSLDVLRALERGEIDLDEARQRLAALDGEEADRG